MKFGAYIFPTEYSISLVELGQRLEEAGFESLWVTEHTHIPTSRTTPWPGGRELPREYSCTFDPFLGLTAVASATERLVLGTGVCLLNQRNPIVTAKEVATLDHFSGGRFRFGIGAGWNIDEMENHGVRPAAKWKTLRERVEAMKEIWSNDEASYHGELVDFDPIWQWPKPLHRPHPPILLGGAAPGALRRVVRYCDGWIPIGTRAQRDFREPAAELARLAEEAGRPRPSLSIFGTERTDEAIACHAQAGAERVVFGLPSEPAETVVPLLARDAELARRFGESP
ncbi:MAG: LLM class F420-dependent oxidoreductase [Actinomycetia bacterium]|nr:LLM class F420-dependent oxidoreductase [Actinomycetes bacterium]